MGQQQDFDIFELPDFGTAEWAATVRAMVNASAPDRFAVVGHDAEIENSAILAWGQSYENGTVIVESASDDRRWVLDRPEQIRKHFPRAPMDGLEIIWIDGPNGVTDEARTGTANAFA